MILLILNIIKNKIINNTTTKMKNIYILSESITTFKPFILQKKELYTH